MELIYIEIYSFILTEKFHGDIGRSLTFAPEDETNISLNSWYVSFVSIIYIVITIKTKGNWSSSFCLFVYIYNKKTSLRSLFFISSHTLADLYSQDSLTLVLLISLTFFRFFYSLHMYIFLYPMLALIGYPGSRKHYGNPGRRKSYAVLSRASFKDSVSMKRDESTFFSIW